MFFGLVVKLTHLYFCDLDFRFLMQPAMSLGDHMDRFWQILHRQPETSKLVTLSISMLPAAACFMEPHWLCNCVVMNTR